MLDPFLLWLESTPLSTWTRESTSIFAFPMILAVHTVGLGLLAGLNGEESSRSRAARRLPRDQATSI